MCSSWAISPKYVNPHKAVGCQLFAVEVEGTAPISLFTVLRNPLPATVGSLVHAGPKALLGKPIDRKRKLSSHSPQKQRKGRIAEQWKKVDFRGLVISSVVSANNLKFRGGV